MFKLGWKILSGEDNVQAEMMRKKYLRTHDLLKS